MTLASNMAIGAHDLKSGMVERELWIFMGWQDIRQRYRRTILGPWWLAISTAILVVALGILWSEIFHVEVRAFLPYFAVGYVLWQFLSGVIIESCTGFTQFEGLIKQRQIPLSTYIYRIGMRHAFILAHNVLVIAIVIAWSGPSLWPNVLLVIPGFAIFASAVLMCAVPVAILCTRFRDMPQIVANVMQVLFFVTPIMWRPESLVGVRWVAEFNPLAHLVDIVRLPLLGIVPAATSWLWAGGLLLVSSLAGMWLLGRYGHRVAYWL